MKPGVRYFILFILLLLVSGCSTVPFQSTELVPASPATTAALVNGLRSAGRGSFLVRQSALFELKGNRIAIEGVMRLDQDKRQARLVAMNEMGVKLFDLVVDAATSEALFTTPELSRYPGVTEAVATSVRRIFLAPEPSQNDLLAIARESYLLTRTDDDRTISFVIGGRDRQLLEKSCVSKSEQWRVRYFEYQQKEQLPLFPRGIVLDDELAGYRLTLWLESVEKSDE
jgi:hypothetical protein